MNDLDFLQRSRAILWAIAPFLIALFCVMVYAAPFHIGDLTIPMPVLPLMAIYFWTMRNPRLMPPIAIFLIGLFQDFVTGGPVGLWALAYLLSTAIMATQREIFIGRGRTSLWVGFMLAILITTVLVWVIARLSLGAAPFAARLGMEMLITLIFYPAVGRIFSLVHRATNQSRRMVVNSTMGQF